MEKKDIVLITGGNGNIAQAVIKKYLENDCIVVATDLKESTINEEFEQNKNFSYYKCDVTNVNDIEKLKENIEKEYGRVTHIISMAGTSMGTDIEGIEKVTIEDIDNTVKLNLLSHMYVTTIFLSLFQKETNTKTITYISSINALKAYDVPIYSASKAGLIGLMRGELQDLGRLGIRVNVLSPGTVLRPWEIVENEKTNGEYASKRPKVKYGEFAINTDIAEALYCITHIMKKLEGQNIVIDAGQMA